MKVYGLSAIKNEYLFKPEISGMEQKQPLRFENGGCNSGVYACWEFVCPYAKIPSQLPCRISRFHQNSDNDFFWLYLSKKVVYDVTYYFVKANLLRGQMNRLAHFPKNTRKLKCSFFFCFYFFIFSFFSFPVSLLSCFGFFLFIFVLSSGLC